MKIPVETTPSEPTKVLVKSSNLSPAMLDASDRCDKCGIASRAYVAVMIFVAGQGPLPLFFCGHHYTEYEPVLREKAVMTLDERWHLTESVKAQKNAASIPLETVRRGGV